MIVDDAFLPADRVRAVSDYLLADDFPWYLNRQTVPEDYSEICPIEGVEKIQDRFQFTHTFYRDYFPTSDHLSVVMEPLSAFLNKHEIPLKAILRAKANLATNVSVPTFQPPHVDHLYGHKVFLYYVNDADGDTTVFSEDYNAEEKVSLTVGEKVSPKAGRAIMFDGMKYHAGSMPMSSDYRCVLNVTFL
jgi:hypothetical protein